MPRRKSRGGGWSTGPDSVSPGNLVYNQYSGPGKDCPGVPVRPGTLDSMFSSSLPGLRGGRRRNRTRGGRYEVIPGPILGAGSAIGMSGLSSVGRIPCEAGTTNVLNPNMTLQMATTAVGGRRRKSHKRRRSHRRRVRGGNQTMSPAPVGAGFGGYSNFPVVHVGAADSMRYNAPTAGYRNDFEAFPSGSPVPGVMLQVPNDARGGNLACTTTGGSRRRGGATNPADYAMPIAPGQIMSRSDFDGTQKGLPVKFGGARHYRKQPNIIYNVFNPNPNPKRRGKSHRRGRKPAHNPVHHPLHQPTSIMQL